MAPTRVSWRATLALVSVLHTSGHAVAQTAPAQTAPAQTAPAQTAPAQTAPAETPAATASAESSDAAPSPRDRARTAYSAGKEAFAAGQYAAAAAHFAHANSLIPAAQAQYWRAMSLDQLQDVPAAYEAFSAVLAAPDSERLSAEQRATAEARHAALAAVPARLTITSSPAGASVTVSGVALPGVTPMSARLGAGRHIVEVSLPGHNSQRVEINATPGGTLAPSVVLTPTTPAPSAPPVLLAPTLAETRSNVPGYVTLGIAGASAVVGTIFGVRALGDKDDFKSAPSTDAADDVERNALIADMAFGVALTLGITGIVLLVADDPMPEQAASPTTGQRVTMTPYLSPTGAGAAARLTF